MKLDLSEIAAHLGKRIKYVIDEPPMDDPASGLKGVERITGDVTFSNTGSAIVVRGRFHTAVEVECSRCLRGYVMPVDMPIEEELPISGHLPWMPEDEEENEELPETEKEPLFVDNIFDLSELLRQSIVVSVPIKPLCAEACKGLCSHCGVNLNEGECECQPDMVNSPFGALASLMKDEEEK